MSTLQATDSSTKATDKQYNSICFSVVISLSGRPVCGLWCEAEGVPCDACGLSSGRARLCWAWGGVRSRV